MLGMCELMCSSAPWLYLYSGNQVDHILVDVLPRHTLALQAGLFMLWLQFYLTKQSANAQVIGWIVSFAMVRLF